MFTRIHTNLYRYRMYVVIVLALVFFAGNTIGDFLIRSHFASITKQQTTNIGQSPTVHCLTNAGNVWDFIGFNEGTHSNYFPSGANGGYCTYQFSFLLPQGKGFVKSYGSSLIAVLYEVRWSDYYGSSVMIYQAKKGSYSYTVPLTTWENPDSASRLRTITPTLVILFLPVDENRLDKMEVISMFNYTNFQMADGPGFGNVPITSDIVTGVTSHTL